MSTIPQPIRSLLKQKGIQEKEMLTWLECDRDIDENVPRQTIVVLTADQLLIAKEKKEAAGSHVRPVSADADAEQMETASYDCSSFSLEEVEAVTIVPLAASGMIVVKMDGQEQAVAAFQNGKMFEATRLVKIFDKLKKKEKITEEDLKDRENKTCPTCGRMYPNQNRQICPRCMKKRAIFFRLLSFAGAYKGLIALIVLFMLLNSATGLVIPYLQGEVLFDQALGNTGPFAGQIALVILLIIGFRTLSLVFGIIFGMLNARLAANVAFGLKSRIFESMQRLSLSFYQKKQTGQLMTRVNNDATELQFFFVDGIPYFILNAMNIVGILTILLFMDWKLTLICLVPLPLVLFLTRTYFPKLWRLAGRRHRRASSMNSLISDTLRGARVVKAFGKEREEIRRFQHANVSFSNIEQSFNKMVSTLGPVLMLLTQFGGLLVWGFGGWKVIQSELTFGQLFSFVTYIYMLFGPIQFMNNIVNWWSYCMSAAQRIFEIQDAVPEVAEKKNPVHLEQLEGRIEVNRITFGYEPNKPVLKEVSMKAEPGQMIGVVGRSGAGKSTLVNLISRLYDVEEGEIRIDGVNVKDLSNDTLRKHIGIVSQEVYVFMGTIAENIAYANPDCTMGDIIRAAKIANAHDFIEKLPDGYDTITGTGGYSLSGGEKQRISIARAILHNPKILILDEATASLDTETELQIQESLEKLMKGRTTIAIAHRLSTLRNADYLLVMEQGEVVEEGTHAQLMEQKGAYYDLVKKHEEALKMKGVG